MIQTFTVPGRPVAKGRPRFGPHGPYTPKRTRDYEEHVGWCVRAAKVKLRPTLNYKVRVEAYFSKGPWPDADNVLKSLLDGIQKGCPEWNDRNALHCEIIMGKAEVEGCRVSIEEVPA